MLRKDDWDERGFVLLRMGEIFAVVFGEMCGHSTWRIDWVFA
jgi:hypothetical protein